MCGLAGVILKPQARKPQDWQHLKEAYELLFKAAESRGRQASGLVVVNNDGKFMHIKGNMTSSSLIKTDAYQKVIDFIGVKTTCVMAHTRMPTTGTVLNPKNNHPIRVGAVIGAHNGIIGNVDALYTKFKYERLGEVDSEILIRFAETSIVPKTKKIDVDSFHDKMKEVTGQVVFTFMNLHEPKLVHLVRPDYPLVVRYSAQLGAYLWTSEYNHMTDALKGRTKDWSFLNTATGNHYIFDTDEITHYTEQSISTANFQYPDWRNNDHYNPPEYHNLHQVPRPKTSSPGLVDAIICNNGHKALPRIIDKRRY